MGIFCVKQLLNSNFSQSEKKEWKKQKDTVYFHMHAHSIFRTQSIKCT